MIFAPLSTRMEHGRVGASTGGRLHHRQRLPHGWRRELILLVRGAGAELPSVDSTEGTGTGEKAPDRQAQTGGKGLGSPGLAPSCAVRRAAHSNEHCSKAAA